MTVPLAHSRKGWASGALKTPFFSQSQGMDAPILDIEPEKLAQLMVDRLKEADLREYVLEDLTETYTDLQHDSPYEYREVINQFYPQDV